MQITITTRHGDLSPLTQEKIRAKVSKLPRFFDRVTAIQVIADLQDREALRVELRASVEQSEDLVAVEQANELMVALDSVIRKIERQLRKHKEKVTQHRATGVKRIETPTEPPAPSQ